MWWGWSLDSPLYFHAPFPFLKTDSIMFDSGPPGKDSPQAAGLSRWWGPRCGRKDACCRSPGPGAGVRHRRRTRPCAAFGWRYSGPARPGCSAAIPFPYLQRTETPAEFRKWSVHYTYKCLKDTFWQQSYKFADFHIDRTVGFIWYAMKQIPTGRPLFKPFTLFFKLHSWIIHDFHINR